MCLNSACSTLDRAFKDYDINYGNPNGLNDFAHWIYISPKNLP